MADIFDSIILVDKPSGMTSFGVVARIRRVLTQQKRKMHAERGYCNEPTEPKQQCRCKLKVGHTGTLDPFATGLMIVLTGKMCREASNFSKLDKSYSALIELGAKSSTGDPEGSIDYKEDGNQPDQSTVADSLKAFTGDIVQTPPTYSAIKIDGQRAYKLARRGDQFEMPKRKVTIHSLELLEYEYPNLRIKAEVSSGTYIRTLAEDMGERLGTVAYCKELRRNTVGSYNVEQASRLEDIMREEKE